MRSSLPLGDSGYTDLPNDNSSRLKMPTRKGSMNTHGEPALVRFRHYRPSFVQLEILLRYCRDHNPSNSAFRLWDSPLTFLFVRLKRVELGP